MGGIKLYGDWDKSKSILKQMEKSLDSTISRWLFRETEILRSHILNVFETQGATAGWQPLSRWTLVMRRYRGFRGTTMLQQTGQLRNSIVTKVDTGSLSGFVGVLYQTKNGGKRMVNIAKVQEFGMKPVTRRWTLKQKRFMALVGLKAGLFRKGSRRKGKSFYVVSIPPRPFMKPGMLEWRKKFKSRSNEYFKQAYSRN